MNRPGSRWRRRRVPGSPSAGARGRRLLWFVPVLAVVLVVVLIRPRLGREPGATKPQVESSGWSEMAMLDSLRAADARKDWVAGLLWAERLGARRPRDALVLVARGTAWSNYAIGARAARAIPRPAVRTSLERTACQVRALGLTDSATRFARDEAEWMQAVQHLGQLQEVQGLPGDALLAYELMRRQRRNEPVGMLRATWLRAMLRDPLRPDTVLYDRRMRQLGLR